MMLTPAHFPLPCSLQKCILKRYGGGTGSGDTELYMDREELITYLKTMDCDSDRPLEDVIAQCESLGDPARPGTEHAALLRWLGAAFSDWDDHCALAATPAAELRRMRSLLAAQAIVDPRFVVPGAHPLHRIMDLLQQHLIGWQPGIGRVGQVLEQRLTETVDAALAWFDQPTTDLDRISSTLATEIATAESRVARQWRRLAEEEQGRIRIANARRQAALMINQALGSTPTSEELGEILKGPWYDSAQLVLLKSGEGSTEWRQMTLLTTELAESLQPAPAIPGDAATARFQAATARLSAGLRKWLLSIERDGEALEGTVARYEALRSELLRGRDPGSGWIAPLSVAARPAQSLPPTGYDAPREGQWFLLRREAGEADLRGRLTLHIEEEGRLAFTNLAGLRVCELGISEFEAGRSAGRIGRLDTGVCFSRCLARCAGVNTQEDLDQVTGVAAERALLEEKRRLQAERARAKRQMEQAAIERAERERQHRAKQMLEQLARQQEALERQRREREVAEEQRQQAWNCEQRRNRLELAEMQQYQDRWESLVEAHFGHRSAMGPAIRANGARAGSERTPSGALQFPPGTWAGFRHDDEARTARLMVYERESGIYIFADRYGTRVRQLDSRELLLLLSGGSLDIFEARSRFREDVSRQQLQTGNQAGISRAGFAPLAREDRAMSEEMRRHQRFPVENTIFVELVAPEFGSNDASNIVRGRTQEISREGLRIMLEHALPVNAILQLGVELPAAGGTHYLVGEVMWCQPHPGTGQEPGWLAGMALFNADGSDIEDWQALVALLEG